VPARSAFVPCFGFGGQGFKASCKIGWCGLSEPSEISETAEGGFEFDFSISL
jgi:hypothetical protein